MTALQAALLGVVQGLTEFLPISSSAHLILARAFFGWEIEPRFAVAFDVACHIGTLVAVLVYFRREVTGLAGTAVAPRAWRGAGGDAVVLRAIVIGTVPVAVVGLAAADAITGSLRTAGVAGICLAAGAAVMLAAERLRTRTRRETSLGAWEALGLGVAQASALVPGVSRSGAVLTVAMLLGLRRERAARFAFLLGIPAILAAGARATLDLVTEGIPSGGIVLMGIGGVSSAIVGYLTISYFIQSVSRRSLDPYAIYRLALAGAVFFWAAGS